MQPHQDDSGTVTERFLEDEAMVKVSDLASLDAQGIGHRLRCPMSGLRLCITYLHRQKYFNGATCRLIALYDMAII